MNNVFQGHLLAFICTFIWSTTFVSTKILLEVFTPLEILVIRFTIGIIILKLLSPTRAKFELKKAAVEKALAEELAAKEVSENETEN